MKKSALIITGLLLASSAFAINLPEPIGYVWDGIGKLSSQNVQEMSTIASQLSKRDGAEVAVCLVDNMGGLTVEDYSIKLAQKWKVGKKGKNNGIILLVAKQERKIRIEVGYGLEGVLPDAKAGNIISQIISPRLKSGDWDGGIRAGFNEIVKSIGGVK